MDEREAALYTAVYNRFVSVGLARGMSSMSVSAFWPRRVGRIVAGIAAALAALGAATPRAEQITIFAAASTTNAVTEAAEAFARSPDGQANGEAIEIRTVFAASSTLAMQIARGAPADLFLSASSDWMDYLAARAAIVPASRIDLLSNRLVLITPADRPLALSPRAGFPLAQALGAGRLAIGDPAHVPAGIYARAALDRLRVWHSVADRTALAANVRAVLALVERGEAAAGIIYRSDLTIGRGIRVAATFPRDSHPAITYPLALVAGSGAPGTERFYRYMTSPGAAAIFRRHGFTIAEPGG